MTPDNGSYGPELRAVRARAIALADAILHYSGALDNYTASLKTAAAAGASQEEMHQQVELAGQTSNRRRRALQEFAAKLPEGS